MPEDEQNELTRQGQDEQEREKLAELEVGDRMRAETEEEGEWDELEGLPASEEENVADIVTPEPSLAPYTRPINIPVAPVLSKTGDILWGADAPKPRLHNELDDLFEVPDPEVDNDVYIDDLFEIDEEDLDFDDDLSDLTQVTNEDIMGRPPKPRPPKFRRTGRSYIPPTSMGGVR